MKTTIIPIITVDGGDIIVTRSSDGLFCIDRKREGEATTGYLCLTLEECKSVLECLTEVLKHHPENLKREINNEPIHAT